MSARLIAVTKLKVQMQTIDYSVVCKSQAASNCYEIRPWTFENLRRRVLANIKHLHGKTITFEIILIYYKNKDMHVNDNFKRRF